VAKRTIMYEINYDLSALTKPAQRYLRKHIKEGFMVSAERMAEAWAMSLMYKGKNPDINIGIRHATTCRKCADLLFEAGYLEPLPRWRINSWDSLRVTSKAYDNVDPEKPNVKELCLKECDIAAKRSPRPFVFFQELDVRMMKHVLLNPSKFDMVVFVNYDSYYGLRKNSHFVPFKGVGKHSQERDTSVILFDESVLEVASIKAENELAEKALLLDDPQDPVFREAYAKICERVDGMSDFIRNNDALKVVKTEYPFDLVIQDRLDVAEGKIAELKKEIKRLKDFKTRYSVVFPKGAKEALVEAIKEQAAITEPRKWHSGLHPAKFVQLLKDMMQQQEEKTTK
jgi:hypothetical protein